MAEWAPADQAAFLWIHLYEPHGPYRGDGATDAERYAEEVRRADALLKPVLDRLVAEKARIVVASDHGEVLLEERCGRQHERSTHAVVLRVPLFVWAPDRPPSVEDRLVGLTEVKALLQGASVGSLPERTAWVAESGLCEAGCAPGCRRRASSVGTASSSTCGTLGAPPGPGTFIEEPRLPTSRCSTPSRRCGRPGGAGRGVLGGPRLPGAVTRLSASFGWEIAGASCSRA